MAKKNSFQWRAMVSTLMALTFLALGVSGLILFIAPPGRVANWTDWRILGLTKHGWGGLHIWFATLFLGMTGVHLYFNWRPMMSYLKRRRSQVRGMRLEWLSSAAVALVIFLGTSFAVPPFVSFLDWQESIKESWEGPMARAPIPHAELLTVAELAEEAGIETEKALGRLAAAGLDNATADAVVHDVATAHGLSAQAVYALLDHRGKQSGEAAPGACSDDAITVSAEHPASGRGAAGSGTGWKTLAEFCEKEGIPVAAARLRLQEAGISAGENDTLRTIAQNAGFERPFELLQIIRDHNR